MPWLATDMPWHACAGRWAATKFEFWLPRLYKLQKLSRLVGGSTCQYASWVAVTGQPWDRGAGWGIKACRPHGGQMGPGGGPAAFLGPWQLISRLEKVSEGKAVLHRFPTAPKGKPFFP